MLFDHKAYLKTLTSRPGVYRMIDEKDEVLYVGKARDLKKRVSSYFTKAANARIQSMVAQIAHIQVTVTQTEGEALLLENNFIKSLRPRYNVLLRDDKSYPYIHLSDDDFPRLSFHRGARDGGGRYFGPYPSAGAVRETLYFLQKVFPVRQCENSHYKNRSRPCLQYQIKRCTGPCVGLVSPGRYFQDVEDIIAFLEGKGIEIVDKLAERMLQASANLAFEEAARLRDQIQTLRQVQDRQYVSGERGDLDIMALEMKAGQACVQIFFIRGGRNLGNKTLFPRLSSGTEADEVMAAVIAQHYLGRPIPSEILANVEPRDLSMLQDALSEQAGRKVKVQIHPRSDRARWLDMAKQNAALALDARLASNSGMQNRLEALREALTLDEIPKRMECFDISHTQGDQTVASCVVFNEDGPLKSDYRRFNVRDITGGDDYAAMRQAVERRYLRVQAGETPMPDILFIDGGKGQVGVVKEALADLAVADLFIVGVAKGPERRPGMEQLIIPGRAQPILLPAESPALHLIQQIRDEAHRFAITGHRASRQKQKMGSVLEDIPGVGGKRRQRLLLRFGGMQGLVRAGIDDIAGVEGISQKLARDIYAALHGEA